jgi:hypothetical protein
MGAPGHKGLIAHGQNFASVLGRVMHRDKGSFVERELAA